MIVIPRDLARAFPAVAKKCLTGRPRGPAPAVVCRVANGVRTLWTRIDGVGLRHTAPADGADETLLIPMDVFAAIEAPKPEPVEVSVDAKLRGTASWSDRGQQHTHRFTALRPGKQHAIPELPAGLTPMPESLRSALHECSRSAARDPEGRFALSYVQLRGDTRQVIGTDAKQALIWGGFAFPFTDSILVPAIPVFGSRELPDAPVQIGRDKDEFMVVCGPWSVHLPIAAGKYPDVRQVLPKPGAGTSVTLDDAQAAELLRMLPSLPAARSDDHPVTIELSREVIFRAQDETTGTVEEFVLRAGVTGPPIMVAVNRQFVERALRFGCRTLRVVGQRMMSCEGTDRQILLAPLDASMVVPEPKSQYQSPALPPRSNTMKPDTSGAANGRHPPPAAEPETDDPLAEAEAIRTLLVEVGTRFGRLVGILRSARKEKKVLANVWAGLKQLNLAPGGTS
ncbi:MAG: hypothetical protein U0791_25335 [Gemmataceae bacterium]